MALSCDALMEIMTLPLRMLPVQELTSKIETNLCVRELGLVDEPERTLPKGGSLHTLTFNEAQIRRQRKGRKTKTSAYGVGLISQDLTAILPKIDPGVDVTGKMMTARCVRVVQFSASANRNVDKCNCCSRSVLVYKMGEMHFDCLMVNPLILIDEVRNVLYAIEPIDGKFRDKEHGQVWRPVEASEFRIRQIPLDHNTDRHQQVTFDQQNATVYQFAVDGPVYITNCCICRRTGDLLVMMQQDNGCRPKHVFISIRVPDPILEPSARESFAIQQLTGVSVPFLETNPSFNRCVNMNHHKENGSCWWQNGRLLITMVRGFSATESSCSSPLAIALFRFRYGRGKDTPVRQVKWMRVIPVDWPSDDVSFIGRVGRSLMFQFCGRDPSEVRLARVLMLTNVLHKRRQMIPTRITRNMMKLVSYKAALEKTLAFGHEWLGNFVMEHMISAGGVLYASTSVQKIPFGEGTSWARIRT